MITSAQSDTQHLLGPISHQIHTKLWKWQPLKITSQPEAFLNYIYDPKISKHYMFDPKLQNTIDPPQKFLKLYYSPNFHELTKWPPTDPFQSHMVPKFKKKFPSKIIRLLNDIFVSLLGFNFSNVPYYLIHCNFCMR